MRKKPTRKQMRKKCDDLFSEIIRTRGACESGRRTHNGVLQCAHGWSRGYFPARWDERNAWCLCQGCHVYFTHHPIEWDDWMRERQGDLVYWNMRRYAQAAPITKIDYDEIYEMLQARWKDLESWGASR